MNNTFLTWLVGAAIAGLGLFLLLGAPAGVPTAAAGSSALTTNGASPSSEPTYWRDATPTPMAPAPATLTAAPATCPSCGTASLYVGSAARLAAPATCSSCAIASSRPATAAAPLPVCNLAVAAPRTGLAAGCGLPASPCAETPCRALVASCNLGCGCETPCGGDRPRINRNGPLCVDECSFVQLYSTVPLPACSAIHFAWAATRGHFLDPAAAAPIYYAPGTAFPGGEDVLVTLTVTDAQGNEYSDQIKLHVDNSR
jgi:hypothetical protein